MEKKMRGNATRMTAVLGAVALMTCLATPALASPGGHGRGQQGASGNQGSVSQGLMSEGSGSQGIGIGRLSGLDLTWDQMTAVHRALVEARSTMQMTARSAAIAALLSAGTIDAAQAKALAVANGRSAMRALLASGMVTMAQVKALKDAMKMAGATDRATASLAALKALVTEGIISESQLNAILARLGLTGAPSASLPPVQGQGSTVSGLGRDEGASHGISGHHGYGALGDDDDQGENDDENDDENEDQDEMTSRTAS